MTLYPDGYGTRLVSLAELEAKHGPKMHPTFRTQLFAYLQHKGGLMGIGGGWRATQPDKPGFAPDGKSFHQDQRFKSGIVGYCAVDLVMRNGTSVHRAPTWAETVDAQAFLLHTFIQSPPEPWHIQPINIRGWQTWVNEGRPDPQPRTPQPPNPPAPEEDDMPAQIVVDTKLKGTFACVGGRWVPWLVPIPPGVPVFTGDHVWTREQILADQGEPAEALWRERAAKK